LTFKEKITSASDDVVLKIKNQDPLALRAVYREIYPMIEKFVLDNSGTRDEAKDVFQDALFIFIRKIDEPGFELSSKLSTYIFGIGRFVWLKVLASKKQIRRDVPEDIADVVVEEEDYHRLTKVKSLNEELNRLGEPCRSILVAFYYHQENMSQIAEKFNYSNPENAKNQKYKCLMRLKKLMIRQK